MIRLYMRVENDPEKLVGYVASAELLPGLLDDLARGWREWLAAPWPEDDPDWRPTAV